MKVKGDKWQIDRNIVLIVVCIFINLGGKLIASTLKLPLWLDVIGTCVAAYFTGTIGAVASGVIGNLIYGLVFDAEVLYLIVSAVLGMIFHFCARKGYFDKLVTAVMSSFVIGVVSVLISAPLNICLLEGKTGNFWGDIFYDMLDWYGFNSVICCLGAEAIIDIVDKQISVLIAFGIIRLIKKYREKINFEKQRSAARGMLVALTVTTLLLNESIIAKAEEQTQEDRYVETIYDSHSGMVSSEANDIAETQDGYIWIGSNAGLTRYDGREFEFIQESGATGVTVLLTDTSGRLWIGTNDSGIIVYQNGIFTPITVEDGLPVNSVHSLVEAPDGSIYAGTTDNICKLVTDENGKINITVIRNELTYVNSMTIYKGRLVGVTITGKLFVMRQDEIVYTVEPSDRSMYFSCVSVVGDELWAGTKGDYIEQLELYANRALMCRKVEVGDLNNIMDIREDSLHKIWICADNGIGYIFQNENGEEVFHTQKYQSFDASVECMHEDYEGNIWFASSRYGVMKLCESKFTNVFAAAGVESAVANAVLLHQGKYYCGTDNGLVIINSDDYSVVESELTDCIGDARVRCIMADSKENIWICTYGEAGLVCYKQDGTIVIYNEQNQQTVSERFRCTIELSDGTIAAGTSNGIYFIEDDSVIGKVMQDDGLENAEILSMYADQQGRLYAATDGAGIYVLENRKIVKRISSAQGLTSEVVLRLTPYKEGCFVIASNSLCYMENDIVKPLRQFPYFNNYDLLIFEDDAYVISSAGIYLVNADELISEETLKYRLFNYNDGLSGGLTAYSWNMIDDEGKVYFCGNKGVSFFSPKDIMTKDGYLKSAVSIVLSDGKILTHQEGVFTVPADIKTFTVKASVMKYSLSDVKTRFYIGGIDDEQKVLSNYELEPIQISNLKHGRYLVHFQILSDDESEILQEKVYLIKKEAHAWENTWYIVYLVVVGIWMITFFIWVSLMLFNILKRRQQLEMLRKELEHKVQEQTERIQHQADEMETLQWKVIEGMASLIESRDGNTGDHVKNTAKYVSIIANEMLRMQLHPDMITKRYVDIITRVAPLHDVGKIKVSDVILNKPGKFTAEEYEIMKGHAAYGGEIIEVIFGKDADSQMVQIAKDIACYHHEKWDGTGYPEGRSGENIPLSARIMAVADVFDALVSKRVYKEAFDEEKAFQIIQEEAGKQFDREIVAVFVNKKEDILKQLHENNAKEC